MLGFIQLLEAKSKPVSTGSEADSYGKMHEILVGKALNGGEFPEDYRVEGKKPGDIHDAHAIARFGENFANHPQYKAMVKAAGEAAAKINAHLSSEHGVKKAMRTAWTSQASDHGNETGIKDPLNKADLILTGPYKGDHKSGKKFAISLKYGKLKKTNYSNPGLKTLSEFSGRDLTEHQQPHRDYLRSIGNPSHEEYKVHDKKAEIEESSSRMCQNVANDFANGLRNKHTTDEELKHYIRRSVGAMGHVVGGDQQAGKTHLPHIIAKTKTQADGTHKHSVMSGVDHVNNYLSHFKDLEVRHQPGQTSVAVYGTHRGTGKKMEVHRISIYMGGQHETANPRGATTLGSEGHASVDTSRPFSSTESEEPTSTPASTSRPAKPRAVKKPTPKAKPISKAKPIDIPPMDTSRPLSARLGESYLRKIIKESKMANDKKSAEEKGEYDYEGDMAKSQLKSIITNAQRMHDMLEETTNLPEWVQSKITLAEDYILTATNYMEGEMSEEYSIQERINMAKAKMGDVIKDFYKSDAPQFAGRSKSKRRQMAIAAKLGAMRKSRMSEELKGNQHKIDANKNNKIDAHDFKLLRSKLKVKKEEVELDEAPYMGKGNHKPGWMLRADPELARKFKEIEDRKKRMNSMMKKYGGKTGDEIAKMRKEEASPMIKPPSNRFDNKKDAFAHAKTYGGKVYRHEYVNPRSGMKSTTYSVKEEVEQVNELKKSTLGSYIKKASSSAVINTRTAAAARNTKPTVYSSSTGDFEHRPDPQPYEKKASKRLAGISKAVSKMAKEEVEQVDEVIGNTTGYSDSGPRNKADERKFHQMRNVVTKGSRTGKITKYAQNRLKARLKDKTYMDK